MKIQCVRKKVADGYGSRVTQSDAGGGKLQITGRSDNKGGTPSFPVELPDVGSHGRLEDPKRVSV